MKINLSCEKKSYEQLKKRALRVKKLTRENIRWTWKKITFGGNILIIIIIKIHARNVNRNPVPKNTVESREKFTREHEYIVRKKQTPALRLIKNDVKHDTWRDVHVRRPDAAVGFSRFYLRKYTEYSEYCQSVTCETFLFLLSVWRETPSWCAEVTSG